MILVTCAAGGAASHVIPQLVKRGLDVRALDISEKVENLKEIGVKETMVGNCRDREVIEKAMAGCDQVLYMPPLFVYDEADMAKLCIDVATEAGVKQFVMMSVTHPDMSIFSFPKTNEA